MNYEESIEKMYLQSKKNIAKFGHQNFNVILEAMVEELGALAQAYLQFEYEGKPRQRIVEEAVDLGALCFQFDLDPLVVRTAGNEMTDLYNSPSPTIDLLRVLTNLSFTAGQANCIVCHELKRVLFICGNIVEAFTKPINKEN